MLSTATSRSILLHDDRSDESLTLLQRLRIGGNKSNSSKPSLKVLQPFRRRTESVNTIMSTNSMVSNSNETAAPDVNHVSITPGLEQRDPSILEWLGFACPSDVVPKIFAYCGPQQVCSLSKTNKYWHAFIRQEKIWRVMCEDLYKWKPSDPEPESWFDLYCYTPCVPIDYSTIPKALSIALETVPLRNRRNPPKQLQQIHSVRILLRPGAYWLKQAIEVQAIHGVVISIETMELPTNLYQPVREINEIMEQPLPFQSTEQSTNKRRISFRNLFRCKRQHIPDETDMEETDYIDDWRDNTNHLAISQPNHACLILRSRRHNEPVIRVRQGYLYLRNIEIQHNSQGLDIWNGNAAVQIQPPIGEDEHPIQVEPRPTACLERVQISSQTGRGIVNIDGGKVILRKCAVADCAATGIYIGGPGSQATIEETDVIRNGLGNRVRRGIARGHSGIYLEQGIASIRSSNVSSNTLTGVSVVSTDNALLTLEDSTLMNNGTFQLELPPPGTISRQQSVTNNNTMAVRGEARLRSGLTLTDPVSIHHQGTHMLPIQIPHVPNI